MKNGFIRKEVWLASDVVKRLQILADAKKWPLKLYMEEMLANNSLKALKSKKKL